MFFLAVKSRLSNNVQENSKSTYSKASATFQTVQRSNGGKPSDCKPRKGQDIARVVLDFYRISPHDLFGSLSVMATFQGLYSVGADFQLLGPKKLLK